jgi:NADH dehydrogenase FAD-containing subunit
MRSAGTFKSPPGSRARVTKRKVVVAGAGFAGVRVAKLLESDCEVTLVAPTDRFVYLPLIHEVLSENVRPAAVAKPLSEILPKTRFVHGRAQSVEDFELVTAAGERLPFDDVVIAVGAEPNDFGVPGVQEHALSFYSVGDALRANATLKMAATEVKDRPLRVVVAGASFTGVEVAGETAMLLDKISVEHEIVLLDAMDKIFPHQGEEFRTGVMKGIERLGMRLETGKRIASVESGDVRIAAAEGKGPERVPADVVFWCAGAKPRRVQGVNPNVRPTLQSEARDHVWLVGDAADFPREMKVPKLAQTAEAQARLVAHNILARGDMEDYRPDIKGLILSIGHNFAVAELASGQVFTGAVPWHVKRNLYKARIKLV